MLDESDLDETDDLDDFAIDESYYDETISELGYRWRDPLRPTGIGDSEDIWY